MCSFGSFPIYWWSQGEVIAHHRLHAVYADGPRFNPWHFQVRMPKTSWGDPEEPLLIPHTVSPPHWAFWPNSLSYGLSIVYLPILFVLHQQNLCSTGMLCCKGALKDVVTVAGTLVRRSEPSCMGWQPLGKSSARSWEGMEGVELGGRGLQWYGGWADQTEKGTGFVALVQVVTQLPS